MLLGKSGVGKTTLGNHCVRTLQDCRIINGDKPFLHCQEDAITAYGTPWNGKEGYGENSRVTIAYLVFVNQGAVNRCRALTAEEAAFRLLGQISIHTDRGGGCATGILHGGSAFTAFHCGRIYLH